MRRGLQIMTEHPTGTLADALSACGVDLRQVEIEWDELCQEDVLTFADKAYSERTMKGLADVYFTFPSRFVFATDALQAAFERTVGDSPRMRRWRDELDESQRRFLETANLSAFKAFDSANETLSAFAVRVEEACGFSRNELLTVRGDAVFIEPAKPTSIAFADFEKVLPLLMQAAPSVEIRLTGEDPG